MPQDGGDTPRERMRKLNLLVRRLVRYAIRNNLVEA